MAARSTRQKIRDQAKKCLEGFNTMDNHLLYMYTLSAGDSDFINENLPMLLEVLDIAKNAMIKFYDGL